MLYDFHSRCQNENVRLAAGMLITLNLTMLIYHFIGIKAKEDCSLESWPHMEILM